MNRVPALQPPYIEIKGTQRSINQLAKTRYLLVETLPIRMLAGLPIGFIVYRGRRADFDCGELVAHGPVLTHLVSNPA